MNERRKPERPTAPTHESKLPADRQTGSSINSRQIVKPGPNPDTGFGEVDKDFSKSQRTTLDQELEE